MAYVHKLKKSAPCYKLDTSNGSFIQINGMYKLSGDRKMVYAKDMGTDVLFTIKGPYVINGKQYHQIIKCSDSKYKNLYIEKQSTTYYDENKYINIVKNCKKSTGKRYGVRNGYTSKLYTVEKDDFGFLILKDTGISANVAGNNYYFSNPLGITKSMMSSKNKVTGHYDSLSKYIAINGDKSVLGIPRVVFRKQTKNGKKQDCFYDKDAAAEKKAAEKKAAEINALSEPGNYYFQKSTITTYSEKITWQGYSSTHKMTKKGTINADSSALKIKKLTNSTISGGGYTVTTTYTIKGLAVINSPSKYKGKIVSLSDLGTKKKTFTVSGPTLRYSTLSTTTVEKYNKNKSCPYKQPTKILSYGMIENGVRWVQWQLNKWGYTNIVIDGKFGPATKSAVLAFQKSKSLIRDGIVGQKTRNALAKTKTTLGR